MHRRLSRASGAAVGRYWASAPRCAIEGSRAMPVTITRAQRDAIYETRLVVGEASAPAGQRQAASGTASDRHKVGDREHGLRIR